MHSIEGANLLYSNLVFACKNRTKGHKLITFIASDRQLLYK